MAKEKEIVVVCKIGDMQGFKEAETLERQSQLELFVNGKGRIRVRKTESEDGTDFVSTIKSLGVPGEQVKSVEEINQQVNSQFFEGFKLIASALQVKTRYTFEGEKSIIKDTSQTYMLPPVSYEVDVFERPDGRLSDWCKIDIELNPILDALSTLEGFKEELLDVTVSVTHLPFKPQNAFIVGLANDEQLKLLDRLWEEEWAQDPHGGPRKQIESSVAQEEPKQQSEQQSDPQNGEELKAPENPDIPNEEKPPEEEEEN